MADVPTAEDFGVHPDDYAQALAGAEESLKYVYDPRPLSEDALNREASRFLAYLDLYTAKRRLGLANQVIQSLPGATNV